MFGIARLNTLSKNGTETPFWILSYSKTGTAGNIIKSITTDNEGNVITGWGLSDTTLVGSIQDAALIKFNKFGVHQWTRRVNPMGTTSRGIYATTSSAGLHYLYVQGNYTDTASLQYSNLYAVNSTGTFQSYISLNHIANQGNAQAMFNYADNIYYSTILGTAGITFTTSTGVIHKSSLGGTVAWARQLTNTGINEYSSDIVADGSYVITAIPNAGTTVIIAYNDAGTLQYQRTIASTEIRKIAACSNATLGQYYFCLGQNAAGTIIYLLSISPSGTLPTSAKQWTAGGYQSQVSLWVDAPGEYVYTLNTDTAGSVANIQKFDTLNLGTTWQRNITFTSINAGQTRAISITGDSDSLYIGVEIQLTASNETKSLLFKIPQDGTKTGTYTVDGVSITYASATITITSFTTTFTTATTYTLSTVTATSTALATPTVGTVANTTTTVTI
jgi:hypothetical protein